MTHDGTKDIIYFNGVQVNEKNAAGALDVNDQTAGDWLRPNRQQLLFHGSLDEVQIYNVALTATQIAALYAAQNQPPANSDTEAPCAPLNLTATVTFTNVQLAWLPATDNVEVVSYNVYQDGVQIGTTLICKPLSLVLRH
jgi:hypothetical protein